MAIELPDARHLSDQALQVIRERALRGIELGYTQSELAALLGVCQETISRWWVAYSRDGSDALPGPRTGRPNGSGRMLSDQQAEQIRTLIDQNSPEELDLPHAMWTRRAIGDLIRKEYQIDLADRTVGLYLQRWGYTAKKPSRRSDQQEPDEVQQWLIEQYPAIEKQAHQEDAQIMWADEVGVQADHQPGQSYAPEGERAVVDFPRPHIRINQITAISNEGDIRFMRYESMNAEVYLEFLSKLVAGSSRKILLIVDHLQAHKTPKVEAWLTENQEQIEVYYVPRYAPELNPVEYLNNDLKGRLNKEGMPQDKGGLRAHLRKHMGYLAAVPAHIMSFFMHPRVQYAAPVPL